MVEPRVGVCTPISQILKFIIYPSNIQITHAKIGIKVNYSFVFQLLKTI